MQEYEITITETLSKKVKVKASDYHRAKEKVKDMYYDSAIILTEHDFQDVEFD